MKWTKTVTGLNDVRKKSMNVLYKKIKIYIIVIFLLKQ
jgi:hypothetical protein